MRVEVGDGSRLGIGGWMGKENLSVFVHKHSRHLCRLRKFQ